MTTIYRCDHCDEEFDFEYECREHEKQCRSKDCNKCIHSKITDITIQTIKGKIISGKNYKCNLDADINKALTEKFCPSYIYELGV